MIICGTRRLQKRGIIPFSATLSSELAAVQTTTTADAALYTNRPILTIAKLTILTPILRTLRLAFFPS